MEFPGVYRVAIDQGNIITQEMVDQLKIGMSRSQVEYVMGTPLIRDTFSPNRWDYVYTLDDRNNDKKERHHLTVIFKDDKLSEFTTDVKPTSEEETEVSAPATDAGASE